jgi:hypothetical protein
MRPPGKESDMRKALFVAVVVVATLGGLAITRTAGEARAAGDEVLVSLGDTVQVEGASIGCRITRLARYGNRIFLDCRRGGRLAGSYGTYVGERDVLVVRFVDRRRARVVLHARHEGGVERCS